jgi:hypothetical protein
LASSDNVTPNSRSDNLIIPCRANKILKFSRHAFSISLSYADGRACRDRLND